MSDDCLIATRTQSPLVYSAMCRKLNLHPSADFISEEVKTLAQKVAKRLYESYSSFKSKNGLVFDKEHLIIRKAYGYFCEDGKEMGVSMYGKNIPFCKDDFVANQFMQDFIDFNNGDAVLCIGRFDRKTTCRLLEESLGRIIFQKRFSERGDFL